MQLETVKIKTEVTEGNPHGYIVINKTDFDADKHEVHEENAQKEPADMTVKELQAALKEKGVEIPEGAKKADLVALLTKPAE